MIMITTIWLVVFNWKMDQFAFLHRGKALTGGRPRVLISVGNHLHHFQVPASPLPCREVDSVDEVAVEMAKKAQGTPSMPRYTPKTTKKGLDTEKGQGNKTIENTKDSVDGVPSKDTLSVPTYQNGDCSSELGT